MSATGQDPETQVWLVRHGETEWSRDGRHTSSTDLPLTPEGEAVARTLKPRLAEVAFDLVLTSPMQRARVTADLTGFGRRARWIRTWWSGATASTRAGPTRRSAKRCPAGRSGRTWLPAARRPSHVAERLDRVVERVGNVPDGLSCSVTVTPCGP